MSRRTRREERERGLSRRGESARGTREHSVVTCPSCRTHLPLLKGFSDLPDECPECEVRLRCSTCGASLVEEDPDAYADGLCPRCEDPVTGEDTGPTSEDFTWNDR